MNLLLVKLRTAVALGLRNLLRVTWFRLGVRYGWNPVRRLRAVLPDPPFFSMPGAATRELVPSSAWGDSASYFGRWPVPVGQGAPDWHANPMTGQRVGEPCRPWWEIPDFDPQVGDIKAIWEASRFDWVMVFAQRAALGDTDSLRRLERWLEDWCKHNPAYVGPNWKCGQEASFRVLHLAIGALILENWQSPTLSMQAMVKVHLQRIVPTLDYAIGQDNNHGTSEAAALFVGGSWLARAGDANGKRYRERGLALLEDRVARLVSPDGSFSQSSVNYHRLLLDTLCVVEVWRARLDLAAFSPGFQERAQVATRWLHLMVDPETGDAPNLGANDGSRLLPLTEAPYRDFRPSVQLAARLFLERRAYSQPAWLDRPAAWLGIPEAVLPAIDPRRSIRLEDGGYGVLVVDGAFAMLRYPRDRFRPNQADALHVDLWRDGRNLLRDGGSYGYNAEPELRAYFRGTAGHNTIQFDGRDQMPSLGRFLFGDWLRAEDVLGPEVESDMVSFQASYGDRQGARHRRRITLSSGKLVVRDDFSGFRDFATLRWRLAPGEWKVSGQVAMLANERLAITASVPIGGLRLVHGWESRHYLEKTEVPVLEVEVRRSGSIVSEYSWQP